MRPFSLTHAALKARNAASIARADEGGVSAIRIYTEQGGVLLAERSLAVPCGIVRPTDNRIQLASSADYDLVIHTGAATWGEWVAGDGVVLYAGMVTDENGFQGGPGSMTNSQDIGPWVIAGSQGTMLYAGGLLALTQALIG